MQSKSKLRREMLEKRKGLDPQFIVDASARIETHLLSLDAFRIADRIGLYAATETEVQTQKLFQRSVSARKKNFFPVMDVPAKTLRFHRIEKWSDLSVGEAGVLQPSAQSASLKDVNDLHVIIVPGIAFDLQGNRLGRGGGYYDRILEQYRGKRIGLAFECQIIESMPVSGHDQRLDWIVTEERIIRIV